MRDRALVLILFALSGAAGLVDQVVWVRHVALAFGNSVHSAALVTAVFLGGLGLGAFSAGRWIDGRTAQQALRTYGVLELGSGALGIGLAWALPLLPVSAVWASGYAVVPEGWHAIPTAAWLVRGGVIAALLGPPAVLMGATLPLLIRAVVDVRHAGWWVGWLYGMNTVGAAFGALAADAWLVPTLGLTQTLWVAAGVNLGAGLVALRLRAAGSVADAGGAVSRPGAVALALLLAGTAAMGMEMVWLRFLGGALGPYRAVFSTVVGTMLLGLAVGAVGGGALSRRFGRPALSFGLAQGAFVVLALATFAVFDGEDLVHRQRAIAAAPGLGAQWWINIVTTSVLVLPPSVAMGAAFPLGNALVQDAEGRLGSRAGLLYLGTTIGNVLGALGTGFVLLPTLGIQGTVLGLSTLAALAPIPLVLRGRWALAGVGVGLLAVVAFALLPSDRLLWASFPANRVAPEGVLAVHEGVEQILVVTGSPEGPARLWTGGHPMTSTTAHAQRYMRLMAHVPLLMSEAPEDVLVICFGVGNTLHAASLHPSVQRLHTVDLSRDVLRHADYFAHANGGILGDPRVSIFVNDGRHHLLTHGGYDLITLEPPPIALAGVEALYTQEFYALARERLADGGLITQWLPAYQIPEAAVRALVGAFVAEFPDSALLVASGREWVLVGSTGASFSLKDVNRRILRRPLVEADLLRIGAPDATQIAATFAADGAAMTVAAAGSSLRDDRPVLEYSQVSHVMETRLPSQLFAPGAIDRWCVDCGVDRFLAEILEITGALYRSEDFRVFSNLSAPTSTSSFAWSGSDEALDVVAASATLQRLFRAEDALQERARDLRELGHWTEEEAAADR